jgi:hypothetical protein
MVEQECKCPQVMEPNESKSEKPFFPNGAIFFFALLLLFYAAAATSEMDKLELRSKTKKAFEFVNLELNTGATSTNL